MNSTELYARFENYSRYLTHSSLGLFIFSLLIWANLSIFIWFLLSLIFSTSILLAWNFYVYPFYMLYLNELEKEQISNSNTSFKRSLKKMSNLSNEIVLAVNSMENKTSVNKRSDENEALVSFSNNTLSNFVLSEVY